MAKRVATAVNLTWTAATAGAAVGGSTYLAVKGGASTQVIDILEVFISGLASSSTIGAFQLARESTLDSGGSALAAPHSDGGMNPSITPLSNVVLTYVTAATTQPTPSNTATDAKLNFGLNMFGGIVRWNAAPTQQWWIIGNTAPGGASMLWNSLTGIGQSGSATAHIIYEPY
jgi:hypothetical protein